MKKQKSPLTLFLPCFAFLHLLMIHQAIAAITLDEAYQAAVARTENIPLSQTRIDQAEERATQAQSPFLPILSIGAQYQQQDLQQHALFANQSFTRLVLSQNLFAGGRDWATLHSRKFDVASEKHNLSSDKINLFSAIAQNFYFILSNEHDVLNIQKILSLTQERANVIHERTAIGKSRRIELLAAKAQVSVLEAQLLAAQGQVMTARDQFALLTGLERHASLDDQQELTFELEAIEHYLKHIDERPDIEALKASSNALHTAVSAAKAGHYPSLNAFGNYYLTRNGPQENNKWDFGLTLNLPLFAGGLINAQVQEAKYRELQAELLVSQRKRQAETEIRTAYDTIANCIKQIKSLESALRSTEQNYKEQERNYRFGQANNLDVIQALNLFQDTKRTLDRTRYQAMAAWANLKAATAQIH